MIKLTVSAGATEAGTTRETLKRRLQSIGIKTEPNKTYSIREIIKAMSGGDLKTEKIGLERARRIALERENSLAEGALCRRSVIEKEIWQEILVPLKTQLEFLPDRVANLVNSEDPVSAHRVLTKAVEEIKKQIADGGIKLKQK